MKLKFLFIIIMIIMTQDLDAQTNAIEWTNLKKYKAANDALTNVEIKGRPRVVFLGNSITEGWASQIPDYFSKNNYVGRGISGQTSAQVLLRFRQDVVSIKPKIVIINIGVNDIAENTGSYSEDYTVGNIASMIDIAKANKIKVIIASVLPAAEFPWRKTITNVADKVISLNKRLQALANSNHVYYLDYHTPLKNNIGGLSPNLAGDGVHPTMECYKLMTVMADEAIKKVK
jgi:lysophospholipase L1-like esterase